MKIGIDLGFGYTKVVFQNGKLKFPTWISYFTRTSLSQIEPIHVGANEYVVGEYARFERNKIEITSIEEMIKYAPVLVLGAIQHIFKKDFPSILTKEKFELAVGIAPKFKKYRKDIETSILSEVPNVSSCLVLPQGYGTYVDIATNYPEFVSDKDSLIIDIGFNTVDYFLISREGEKIKGDTIERLGLTTAVEVFRTMIPPTYEQISNWPISKLISAFETEKVNYQGKELNFSPFKTKALLRYSELLLSRLKDEIGNLILEIDSLILVGGGAYYVDFGREVLMPTEPEYSNARGFYKSLEINENV